MALTIATVQTELPPNRFNVTATRTGGFRVDMKPILGSGNNTTDTEVFEGLAKAKTYFEGQGLEVNVRFQARDQQGNYRNWAHLFAGRPLTAQADEMAEMRAQLKAMTEALTSQGIKLPVVETAKEPVETAAADNITY